MFSSDAKRRAFMVGLALAIVTLVTWWPVKNNAFVNYDDPDYVTQNSDVQKGLTPSSIAYSFSFHAANWHPLTWLSHMLDVTLFKLDPAGHHLVSAFIHTANAMLLFALLHTLTGALWRSALVAALFALHPLRVESVAWIAERKDVLSGFFWLLTLLAYARYAREPGRKRFAMVVACFVLGLMSKPMLVTLPFVLLLLDFWPLNRIEVQNSTPLLSPGQNYARLWTAYRPLVVEKIPLFVLSAMACVVTVFAQKSGGAIKTLDSLEMPLRIANAIVSVARYLGKTFWPTELAVFYPYPENWPLVTVAGALLLAAGISWVAVRWLQRRPWLAVGWLWFLGTLFPVIGLVQAGMQAMADRYTYLPSIGLYIAVVWLMAEWTASWPRRGVIQSVCAATVLGACAVATRDTIRHWRTSQTLFEQALPVTVQNVMAHMSLGNALFEEGKMDEAVSHYAEVLKIRPHYAEAHFNWGNVLTRQQRWPEAIQHYREALRLNGGHKDARINLANALSAMGRHDEAIAELNTLIKSNPGDFRAHNNLGNALVTLGRMNEAVAHFQQALQLNPANTDALDNWGVALADQGKFDEAERLFNDALKRNPSDARAHNELGRLCADRNQIPEAAAHYTEALRLDTSLADAHLNLGMLLAVAGRFDEAKGHFNDALRLRPDSAEAHNDLGYVATRQGKIVDAIQHYNEALRVKPDLTPALNGLARIHAAQPEAKFRDSAKAVKLAERACELTNRQQPLFLDTLAAAYAEAGRFSDASSVQRQALELATRSGQSQLAALFQQHLELYQAEKPLREP